MRKSFGEFQNGRQRKSCVRTLVDCAVGAMKQLPAGDSAQYGADDALATGGKSCSRASVVKDDVGHMVSLFADDRKPGIGFGTGCILQEFAFAEHDGKAVKEIVQEGAFEGFHFVDLTIKYANQPAADVPTVSHVIVTSVTSLVGGGQSSELVPDSEQIQLLCMLLFKKW